MSANGLDNYSPRPAVSERGRAAIAAAWSRGASPTELARAYGVHVRTIHRYLEPARRSLERQRWLAQAEAVVDGGKRWGTR